MGVACSCQRDIKDKPGISKISVRQDGKKATSRPPLVTSKGSNLSSQAEDLELKTDTHRKWIAPLPTPLPKGPLLITPDPSSYTVTTSTEAEQQVHVEHSGAKPIGGGANGAGSRACGDGGGNGFLGVATLHSGHSSVASDVLSATGFSTHSSNSMSISSSLSTNTVHTPSGLHKWKLPPRLEPLSDPLRKLLLGHPESLLDLMTRPDVVNLKVIAPEEDYMEDRLLLWSDVIVTLRSLCAERGFSLAVQDDLWARNSLSERAVTLLAQLEAEVKVGEVLTSHIENPTDVIVLLLTPRFTARLPRYLSHEDYTLILVALPDSSSTALLHNLYVNNANLDPPRYELKVSEVTQHEEVKVKQLVQFMMESFVTQGGDAAQTFLQFYTDYRRAVEETVENHQLLAHNTVVLTQSNWPASSTVEDLSDTTTTLAPHSGSATSASSSRPHSPFVVHGESSSSGQQLGMLGEECTAPRSTILTTSTSTSTAQTTTGTPNATSKSDSLGKTQRKTSNMQIEAFSDTGTVLSNISNHCPHNHVIEMYPWIDLAAEVATDQQKSRCSPHSVICNKVKDVLTRLVVTNIEHRQEGRHQTATGVPRSLLEELVCQTQYCRRLAHPPAFMSPSPGPPSPSRGLLESATLTNIKSILTSDNDQPVLVYAPSGWGLSTLAAQLIHFNMASFPTSLILYRFCGISPDSQTLMSTLLSITQQLDTILGQQRSSSIFSEKMKPEPLSMEPLLHNICKRSTHHLPFLIILEGISLYNRKLIELEVMTLTSSLPPTTKLVLLSSDTDVIRGLRAKMNEVHYVKATPWDKEDMMEMFHKSLQNQKRHLTDSQTGIVTSAIRSCPLPLYSNVVSQIASTWKSSDHVNEDDLPASVEEILVKLLEPPKSIVPCDCFSAMMAYLTGSVGGITPWEMGDLLSVNDTVLQSIYSDVRDPPIHRAPPVYWRVVRAALRSFHHVFVSASFYTETWSSSSMRRCAHSRYLASRAVTASLHREMADQFLGRWAGKKKPYPDPEEEIELLQDRFIMPQPDAFGKFLNRRRYMCLPSHLMLSGNKDSFAIDTCILNLSWIEQKIRATSVLRVLCDLETAVAMNSLVGEEIKLIQKSIFDSSYVLNVNNHDIYKCLQTSIKPPSKQSSSSLSSKGTRSRQTKISLKQFYTALSSPPTCLLYPMDELKGTGGEKLYSSAIPLPAVDDIIPVTSAPNEIFMATLLRSEGEIKIIDIVSNKTVRILTGADHPQRLLMLDSTRAVVLCNRELYVLDLDSGHVITKLRCVLNLRLPLFALQDHKHVVALSRDRMVAQVLDIDSGGIVTSFKAGETRFLDSLLVSGDGRVLVCGDETQKPSPLLVWSLDQCKLLHDIRLPQHEFITKMADISHNGNYLACACREVEDHSSNCVAIYDLVSGQLVKKVKLTGLCVAVTMPTSGDTVLVGLDSGQLLVWDLVAGNVRFLIVGVQASMTAIVATPGGRRCLTYSTENFSISSHTVVLWDIYKGVLLASHTFPAGVTCAHLTADGKMAAVGVRGEYQLTRLLLVPEGATMTQTAQAWRQELQRDNSEKTFGDPERLDAIINLVTD